MKLDLSELSTLCGWCHQAHPGPAPAAHAADLVFAPLEWTFPPSQCP